MTTTPEHSENLLAKTYKWLTKHGYPLELEIGARLAERGFHVTHSVYYRDQRTGKPREIDILAELWNRGNVERPSIRISLLTECKQSPAKPWIVFGSSPAVPEKFFPSHHLTGQIPKLFIWELEMATDHSERLKSIRTPDGRGHGIVRANLGGTKPDRLDQAYRAVRMAAAAATAAASNADRDALRRDVLLGLALFLPVVVVNTTLFELSLPPDQEIKLTEINRARVLVPSSQTDSRRMLVNVVTPQGLPDLMTDVRSDLEFLDVQVTKHWSDLSTRVPRTVRAMIAESNNQ